MRDDHGDDSLIAVVPARGVGSGDWTRVTFALEDDMIDRRGRAGLFTLPLLMASFSASSAAELPPRIDYLSFAQGTLPVALEGDAEKLGVGMAQALLAIDGDDVGYVMTPKPGSAQTTVSFVYKLPALTTFEEFAVPNVLETPSPSQTFVHQIEIAGSDSAPSGPFERLANAKLTTHPSKGQTTSIPVVLEKPVRWVRVSLDGGIKVDRDQIYLEFSELIGHGGQEPVPMADTFHGKWKGRGVLLELVQEGANVSGCYDGVGDLQGTVAGNLLRATGKSRKGDIPSTFVSAVGAHGEITGVCSTNGAPFRLYTGDSALDVKTECSGLGVQPLGCGSIIHGISFDYDSADIRAESALLLDEMFAALKTTTSLITVIGHTSSEGTDAYNLELSQRRAEAIVAAMVERGVDAAHIAAEGRGEKQPIADNASDTGRSLNRRVEIACR